jgi:heme-degrading monooxygenase HmoA
MKSINREALDAPQPQGFIAHLAGPKANGGWRVVDVWESEAAAKAFYESDQFKPVMAAAANAGISTAPWPMHRIEIERALKHKA